MDRDKVIGLFTSGKYQGGAEIKAALHDIVNTYPYFQLAQVLYARQVYDDNDADITNQVKIASAYAPNRRAMYMLFKAKPEVKEIPRPILAPLVEGNKREVVKEELKYNFVYQSATAPVKEKEDTYVSDTVMPPGPVIEERPKESKEAISPVSETFLEREILGAAANATIVKDIVEAESATSPETVQEITEEQAIPSISDTPKAISASETHSFDEWLRLLPSVDINEEEKSDALPKKAADIIQHFLENQPRISKPKAEFFSPREAARHSVMDDDDLVSETLAKILEQQGNHHKAIKAYEVLMLQIPQKKAYFAARIKEIRKIIDSGNTKK